MDKVKGADKGAVTRFYNWYASHLPKAYMPGSGRDAASEFFEWLDVMPDELKAVVAEYLQQYLQSPRVVLDLFKGCWADKEVQVVFAFGPDIGRPNTELSDGSKTWLAHMDPEYNVNRVAMYFNAVVEDDDDIDDETEVNDGYTP